MPDDSRLGKVLGAIGAAALSVITAVVIYRIENPVKLHQPVYPDVGVMGMVSDVVTHKPIEDAFVAISAGGEVESGKTDSEGRYFFKLAGVPSGPHTVTVDVQAGGYKGYMESDVPIVPANLGYLGPELVPLTPQVVTAPAGVGNPGTVPIGSIYHPQLVHRPPVNFVMPGLTKLLPMKKP